MEIDDYLMPLLSNFAIHLLKVSIYIYIYIYIYIRLITAVRGEPTYLNYLCPFSV